jgi:cytoskeletal protein RodZ
MEETLKVFKIYFLSLLLIFAFPVLAQESAGEGETEPGKSVSEDTEEDVEEEEDEAEDEAEAKEEKPAEAKPEEVKPAEAKPEPVAEKPAEAAPAEVKPEPVAEKPAEAPQPKVAVKIESEPEDEKGKDDDKEKENKKFNISVINGFSHGFAKERKAFSYNLTLGATYMFPWQIAFSADVGLNALYRYDLDNSISTEGGYATDEKIDSGVFDGTPLNLGLSKAFPVVWNIGGNLGISAGLPFTSTELWEQYKIYTMLTASLGFARPFKVGKETSIVPAFNFSYTKTFAKYDYDTDPYQNTISSPINEHTFVLGLNLSLAYKGLKLAVNGGYVISRNYSVTSMPEDWYGDGDHRKQGTVYQDWSYIFSFGASISYSIKEWSFGLGVRTNAPEYDSGNYVGFPTVAGDPAVDNGSANYPFKPKYTRVFANIGYSYSF